MLDTAGDSTHVVIAAACILYSLSCVRCYYGTLFCLSPFVGRAARGARARETGPGGAGKPRARGGKDKGEDQGNNIKEGEEGGGAGGGGGARSSTVGLSRCMMAVRTGS